jgi:hypothetical protein
MLLRRSVAIMVTSGAALLAVAAPASASAAHEADAERGMSRICEMMMQDRPGMEHVRESMMRNPAMQRMCEMMMQDRPGMEHVRESMMRNPAMQRMCEMMMQDRPAMAEKCKSMMDKDSTQV